MLSGPPRGGLNWAALSEELMAEPGNDELEMRGVFIVALAEQSGSYELVGSTFVDGLSGLQCYLSPFDALVHVGRNSACVGEGQRLAVLHVSDITPGGVTGDEFRVGMHVAWRARSGQLLLRRDGVPETVQFAAQEPKSWTEAPTPARNVLRLADAIRQRAGLFAWTETAGAFFGWSNAKLDTMVRQAWGNIATCQAEGADPDFDQFAVFDPEFGQWHFVPVLEVMATVCLPDGGGSENHTL